MAKSDNEFIEAYYELCFTCHLPTCQDGSPECPRRKALAANGGKVPDQYYTAHDIAERLGVTRQSAIVYITRYSDIIGAHKSQFNTVGRAGWVVPVAGGDWLVEQVRRVRANR